ncbi:hypothetical protein [Kineococcus arenarius]|uniref:hypothetical protein n=1 Tax=Kineococcus sp. SYSU DK007 TaxID=3383128 RepID=UPI003D7E0302
MPELSPEERTVLEHLRNWYRTHRGALTAEQVADATGLPTATVRAAAGVLAVAAGVRTYHRPAPRRSHAVRERAAPDVVFLDAPQPPRRVIDLTGQLSGAQASPHR